MEIMFFSIAISLMILIIISFRAFHECGCQLRFYSKGSASKGRNEGDRGAGSHQFHLENFGQYPCKDVTVRPLFYEKDNPDKIISGEPASFNHIMPGKEVSVSINTGWEDFSLIQPVGMRVKYKILGIPRKKDVMGQTIIQTQS